MRFTKMHGLGNDYVYVNCFEEKIEVPSLAAKAVSDRHFGIGSDGLILIFPSKVADCRMEMYNADGSRGAMCGNGIRCVGKYVYEAGLVQNARMQIETDSGIRHVVCRSRGGKVCLVSVDMGIPVVGNREILELPGGKQFTVTPVDMGNPHAVLFYSDIASMEISETGRSLGRHKRFPEGVNVEFVQVLDERNMKLRVWERGSGETMACGTGACAACAAAMDMGIVKRNVTVHLKGGKLDITWPGPEKEMIMTGPAKEVFRGEMILEDLTLSEDSG